MSTKTEIAKAIIRVMQEVKGMEKNSRIGAGTKGAYDGTKDQDVKEIFNKALSENGLCMLPIDIQEETQTDRWEEEVTWNGQNSMKTKQSVFTKVRVKYLLLHESGESIELAGYGHGVDPQDKGAGKATTYAMKNCLLYTFCTPVGKMDDTETTHSEAIQTPPKQYAAAEPKKKEPTAWLNIFNDKGEELIAFKNITDAIAKGQTFTLQGIKEKYKVSKKTEADLLKNFNIK